MIKINESFEWEAESKDWIEMFDKPFDFFYIYKNGCLVGIEYRELYYKRLNKNL